MATEPKPLKPLTWAGWKTIRAEIVHALQGKIGESLRQIVEAYDTIQSDSSKTFSAMALFTQSGVLFDLGDLVEDVASRLDAVETALVKACCGDGVSLDEMPFAEAAELRQRLIVHANLREKFEAEKNCLVAIWSQVNPASPEAEADSSAEIQTA